MTCKDDCPFLSTKKVSFLLFLFFFSFPAPPVGAAGEGLGKGIGWEEWDEKEGDEEIVCVGGGRCVLQGGSSCQGDYNCCHLTDQKGGKHRVKDEFPQL